MIGIKSSSRFQKLAMYAHQPLRNSTNYTNTIQNCILQQQHSSLTRHKSVDIMKVSRQNTVPKMPKKPRRHFLKEKEARKLLLDFSQRLKTDVEQLLGTKPRIEVNETEAAEIFIVQGKPLLASSGGVLFPTLTFDEVFSLLPRIVVDMGAVPYVCKGADVMAPGVVSIKGEFKENDFLLVVDERHSKPLAIGVALFNSQATKNMKHGKIVKNVHHVGDKLWNHLRSF